MSATNYLETSILEHIFQNADIPNLGDVTGLRGSSADGNVYVALFTGGVGETGVMTDLECTYTGYARVAVPRNSTYWDVTNDVASNKDTITFPTCTGGSESAECWAIVDSSVFESGNVLFYGDVEQGGVPSSLSISNGVTPEFPIGDLEITAS